MTWAADQVLDRIGSQGDEEIDLAEAALALAALDRPRVSSERYIDHLNSLGPALAAAVAADEAGGAVQLLAKTLHGEFDYCGDNRTYDDMQNANLMRVIDRRKGLPVALGILYIHTARAGGWHAEGLNFPVHFLIAVSRNGEREILDPFDGGARCAPRDLRRRLKQHLGDDAELAPQHYKAVGNRDILLRLLNNILTRAVAARRLARARIILGRMVGIAPARGPLHREMAMLEAHGGALDNAVVHAERYAELAVGASERHDAASLLQRLKRQRQ